jgi:hypothetical protein
MYKLQSANSSTNSIRATQAATNGQVSPMLGPCFHPAGTDMMVAQNFSTGKHLDSISMKISSKIKRSIPFSLVSATSSTFLCSVRVLKAVTGKESGDVVAG